MKFARSLLLVFLGLTVLVGCGGVMKQEEFHEALAQADEAAALKLLEENPELVKGVGKLKETNLQLAIAHKRLKVAEKLLELGAPLEVNPEVKGELAKSGGNPVVLLSLRQVDSDPPGNPFRNFALKLVDAGADVNAVDGRGFTALHHAAGLDDIELVKHLLEKGAQTKVENADGKTPLDMARSEEVKNLLQ